MDKIELLREFEAVLATIVTNPVEGAAELADLVEGAFQAMSSVVEHIKDDLLRDVRESTVVWLKEETTYERGDGVKHPTVLCSRGEAWAAARALLDRASSAGVELVTYSTTDAREPGVCAWSRDERICARQTLNRAEIEKWENFHLHVRLLGRDGRPPVSGPEEVHLSIAQRRLF